MERDRIWRVLHELAEDGGAYSLNQILATAYLWGTTLSLGHSPSAASSVPASLIDLARSWFCPLREVIFAGDRKKRSGSGGVREKPRIDVTLHQMLGFGTEVQGHAERQSRTHILLMQFDTDASLGWMFGDMGNAQFWITPKDLASARFEAVIATVEGG